jgi:hypothetical protein
MARLRIDLELQLLRKGVGALTRERHRCADCGRTPLPGERVHLYARDTLVCALCRPRRRDEPARTELVRSPEAGGSVRLRAAA